MRHELAGHAVPVTKATVEAPAATGPSKMTLANPRKGIIRSPLKIFLYGLEKVGKSSWAAGAPKPIFLGSEDGTSQLDVHRFPRDPETWQDLLDALKAVELEGHDYQTLVVDTIDWCEPMLWKALCDERKWRDIEAPGFGKGYSAALDQWRIFKNMLDRVREKRGMNIILLGHAQIKGFNNPEGANYDRFVPKMNQLASGLFKEWSDDLLFARLETYADTYTDEKKGTKKAYGISTGARLLHASPSAAFDAGNRHNLPETMGLNWDEFFAGVNSHFEKKEVVDRLLKKLEADLRAIGDEVFASRVNAKVKELGESPSLAVVADYANRVAARLMQKQQEGTVAT